MQKTQIALFPLQLFLFPGEVAELYIFEPRYKQLIADCELVNMSFGIPYSKDGNLTDYGCVVKLKKVVNRYDDGSCDIEVEASEIFKIDRYFDTMNSKLYPGGEVEVLTEVDVEVKNRELKSRLKKYVGSLQPEMVAVLFQAAISVFEAGRMLLLSDNDKLNLVKKPDKKAKEEFLINHLKFLELLRMQKNAVKGDIFLN